MPNNTISHVGLNLYIITCINIKSNTSLNYPSSCLLIRMSENNMNDKNELKANITR